MDDFDNIQVEDLAALEAWEYAQELTDADLEAWFQEEIDEVNAELQCLAN